MESLSRTIPYKYFDLLVAYRYCTPATVETDCDLGSKLRTTSWSEWEDFVEIDNESEWKKVKKRNCIASTDVDGPATCLGESEMVSEWLLWVTEIFDWDGAKVNCESLGGALFYRLNGTKSQLDFFYEKMNNKTFYLGVYTSDHEAWRTVDGGTISRELLYFGVGLNGQKRQLQVQAWFDTDEGPMYLDDVNGAARELASVCDLM